ncbi:threonine synthase [Candidatus Bathyarchaeota archaeon]|nr:MAG: threonine synthase [Candidatus Bathyarchaeota archaeon]
MEYEIKCSKCGRKTRDLLSYKCKCGQPLKVQLLQGFEAEKIRWKNYTVWRYSSFFPYVEEKAIITLGEGWTPLVNFSRNAYFKLESLNPTGSFKDRGSTVLISALHKLIGNEGYIAEDSSGNAGASIAAYAARAELKAKIYVPESVSGPKFNQIRFYGADVVKVSGSRSEVTREAQKAEEKKFYIGHVLHPLFRDGIRSLAYEVAEQFEWRVPERIYLPVSAGTLLLGVIEGFNHLYSSGVIDEVPTIVACQTRQVSPLYHRFKNLSYAPPEKITSIADALVSVNPPLLELMVEELKAVKGEVEVVDEGETRKSFVELAKKGFFVEPSSAVAYAAYKKHLVNREITGQEKTLIVLTGSGLKTTVQQN